MTVTITAASVGVLIAAATSLAGFALWAVRAIVSAELRRLNGRYVYAAGSAITGHEIEAQLARQQREIERVDEDLRGAVMSVRDFRRAEGGGQ